MKSCEGFLIYSDSAPEYTKICRELGIQHRRATPNSDEANGRHERFMGVFGDLVRIVLYQSGLPLYLWPYAVQYAANMYNMIILPDLKAETPYEVRYPTGSVPSLAHFGSLCTFVPTKIEKFISRSREGVFVGCVQNPGGFYQIILLRYLSPASQVD